MHFSEYFQYDFLGEYNVFVPVPIENSANPIQLDMTPAHMQFQDIIFPEIIDTSFFSGLDSS